MSAESAPRLPQPPADFLAGFSDASDKAAGGYGWQRGFLDGWAAAVAAGQADGAGFDLARLPFAVAQVYIESALDSIVLAVERVRRETVAGLGGDKAGAALIKAAEQVKKWGT